MLAETCNKRDVPDCEFFINKRDYPQLKVHEGADAVKGDTKAGIAGMTGSGEGELLLDMPVEPYGFIFGKDDTVPEDDVPLSREVYRSYAPIMSFYTRSVCL